jgi:RNA polymerase sigma factor (sigma-70 family)
MRLDDRSDGWSDEKLLRLARERPGGDAARQAASDLLGRYRQRVYLWCFRYVREHERALDLAQDVLLTAFRKLDSYSGRSQFGSWLFAIARNWCLSELRRPGLLLDEEIDLDLLPATSGAPDRLLEESLGEAEILALIRDRLEPREQDALWLRCFERMPVDAITEVLSIQEASGARAVLQQARRKLRAALQERWREHP